jgi:hypothetical protein
VNQAVFRIEARQGVLKELGTLGLPHLEEIVKFGPAG